MLQRVVCPALSILLLTLFFGATALAQPVVDGYVVDPVTGVVEAPYVVQGITYTQDQATGDFSGYLYRAETATELYFAFAQSVHINDNTYGANSIDWPKKFGHRLRDLLNSEHAKVMMYDCQDNLVLEYYLDYATRDKSTGEVFCWGPAGTDGIMLLGDPAHITGASSSLVWNWNLAVPSWPNKATLSPPRVPTNSYDPGTTVDPNYPWIYELVYEWSVSKAAFPGGCFGRLEILEVHNSPLKTATNPVPIPVLVVAKEADPPSGTTVIAGDTILFTVSYYNPGPASLTDVVITDAIDINLTDIVPMNGGVYDEVSRTITWPTIPVLAGGESGHVQFTAVVEPLSPSEEIIYNQAVFTTPDLPTPAETNVTEHPLVHTPDLAVAKACPPLILTGETATYTITVDNLGFGTADAVILTDTLPAQVSFIDATPAPASVAGQVLTFDLGSFAYGQSGTVTINVMVDGTSGLAVNSVAVSTPTVEGGEGSSNNFDSCSSELQGADVYVFKTCPAEIAAGVQATYSIEAGNSGTATANSVVVTDTLPAGANLLNAIPAPSSINGQTLTFDLGDLTAGEVRNITIDFDTSLTSGTLVNQVSVASSSSEGGQGDLNNSDECSSTATAPDLAVTKNCPADMVAGQGASYLLRVDNIGSAPAEGVVLTDTLPDGISFVSAIPAPSSVVGQTLTFDLGSLDAGVTANVTIEVQAVATAGSATNLASATTDSIEGGAGSANNSDSCTSDFLAPDVGVSKTCPVDMTAGLDAAYTILVTNSGTATAANVVVNDVLPDGVSFVSAVPAPSSVAGQTISFSLGDLAAGASATITIAVTPLATEGTTTNTASAATDSVEGGQGSANNADSCSSSFLSPDLSLTKACPIDMIAGENASYTLTVANAGTAGATNVVLIDALPAEVAFISAIPAPASVVGQDLTFNLGDLAAGASTTVTINVTVTATSGTALNSASLSTESMEGGLGLANNDDSCSSNVLSPDVTLAKSCPVDMIAGEGAAYTLTVSNAGSTAALNVAVSDILPDGVAFVSANPAPASVNGQLLTFGLGDLAAGASTTITIDVLAVATSGTGTNSASATTASVEGGAGSANNDDSCSSNFLSPDIALTKNCPVDMVAGENASYSLLVTNLGNTAANNVLVTDTLPAGVSFLSAIPAPLSVIGQELTFDLGDLADGASASITIQVYVDATGGAGDNTATASTDSVEGGQGSANNSDSCSSDFLSPDVALAKSCPVDMIAGEFSSYTLSVSNAGSTDALNVVVTDTLPAGVSFVSATPAPASVVGQTVTFNLGDLAAGGSGTITIDVLATATSGSGTNNASVSTDSVEGGAGSANNSDSCSSNFLSPDIAVAKTCPIDMIAGENAAYTVTVSNGGNTTANTVTLTDVLPAEVSFISATPAPSAVNGQELTFDLGDLEPGASTTITINILAVATAGSATNSASASTASVEGGQGSANNNDSCASNLLSPDISLVKNCPVDMVAGENAAYTLVVSNSGNTAALDVSVVDTLPDGVEFVSATPAPAGAVGQELTFNLGDLAAGGATTITINVSVIATGGDSTNSATASTASVEGGQGSSNNDDSCSSTFLSADVWIAASCSPAGVVANSSYAFEASFHNDGTTDADLTVVTATVPAGFFENDTFSVSASVGAVTVEGLQVTIDVGVLAVGESGFLSISGTVTPSTAARGNYPFATAITTSSSQSTTSNDGSSCTTTVLAPELTLAKSSIVTEVVGTFINSASVSTGEIAEGAAASKSDTVAVATRLEYTITVSNIGDATAGTVAITDILPAGAKVVANPDGAQISGSTATWLVAPLPPGGSVQVGITLETLNL